MSTQTLAIPDLVTALRTDQYGAERVFSAYLDTSPARQIQRSYLAALQAAEQLARADLPADERAAFDRSVVQARGALGPEFTPRGLGVALFVTDPRTPPTVLPLPFRPVDLVAWGPRAHLEPLDRLIQQAERYAILLADKERARLFTIFLDRLEEHDLITDEVVGKQATGGWFALAQARYARHHERMVVRHLEKAVAALLEIHSRRPFDRLLIGGPDEARSLLLHHLPRPLQARLAGTLSLPLYATESEILAAARPIADSIEQRAQTDLVAQLLDQQTLPHVVVDLVPTLAALSEGRLHHLVLVDGFAGLGGHCPTCGRLVPGRQACPTCHDATDPLPDLRETVLATAWAYGTRADIVSGDAATRLMLVNGIGGWTRF